MISNFCHVLNVVCFLLDNSPVNALLWLRGTYCYKPYVRQ